MFVLRSVGDGAIDERWGVCQGFGEEGMPITKDMPAWSGAADAFSGGVAEQSANFAKTLLGGGIQGGSFIWSRSNTVTRSLFVESEN